MIGDRSARPTTEVERQMKRAGRLVWLPAPLTIPDTTIRCYGYDAEAPNTPPFWIVEADEVRTFPPSPRARRGRQLRGLSTVGRRRPTSERDR